MLKQISSNFPWVVVAFIFAVAIYSSCANQGMPTGGPKDSLPPLLIETSPAMRSTGFSGKEVRLTFNEYIIPDDVSEALVVSPPLSKRPTIRTKSKSLIIAFNEELKSNVTYSLDFKNSVADNNERNPYKGLRILFSTGQVIDSLRVAGVVKTGTNLEPIEKLLVMLHRNLDDTTVYRVKPDYIARTDQRGIFLFDNLAPGKYHLFAMNDANTSLTYNEGAEVFAFADSIVIPSANYQAEVDTLVSGADSLLITGHTVFSPEPFYLRTFTENIYAQYLDKSERKADNQLTFVFGETVKDTFQMRLLNYATNDWYLIENNPDVDSLTVWITDTAVVRMDTLKLELSYFQLDSLKQRFLAKDSVNLVYKQKEKQEGRRRKKETTDEPEITQFPFNDNIKITGHDLNIPISVTAPEPIKKFDLSKARVIKEEDLTFTPLPGSFFADTAMFRTWLFDYKWLPNSSYILEIDSAACENIYGVTNRKLSRKFITQKDDYYGRIILDLTSVSGNVLLQLCESSKEEKVIKTLMANRNGKFIFDYLAPNKYIVKLIYDDNKNGKWDTGNYRLRQQPEKVAYLPEIVKVRSNWDNQFNWDLKPDPTFKKELIDKEAEELKLKKQKEEQLKQQQQEQEPVETDFNSKLRVGGQR